MTTPSRDAAVVRLKKIIGRDLRLMAKTYNVTVFKNGRLNKGWAGHVLEKCLGIGLSSAQAPNGLFWELKVVPLIYRNGCLVPKETMAITMINSKSVVANDFEDSHLLAKLQSLIICGRLFEGKEENRSPLVSVGTFDLLDKEVRKQVEDDYKLVRRAIIEKGFESLSGRMGVLVQPRTKGPGHGSTSRAFYARKGFVRLILDL